MRKEISKADRTLDSNSLQIWYLRHPFLQGKEVLNVTGLIPAPCGLPKEHRRLQTDAKPNVDPHKPLGRPRSPVVPNLPRGKQARSIDVGDVGPQSGELFCSVETPSSTWRRCKDDGVRDSGKQHVE